MELDLDDEIQSIRIAALDVEQLLPEAKEKIEEKAMLDERYREHQQKIFPSGRNGSVRVDALRQSRQRHPGGGLLRARRQFNASRSISPSDRCFTVSSDSVGLLF
jgi:hypothetical protein